MELDPIASNLRRKQRNDGLSGMARTASKGMRATTRAIGAAASAQDVANAYSNIRQGNYADAASNAANALTTSGLLKKGYAVGSTVDALAKNYKTDTERYMTRFGIDKDAIKGDGSFKDFAKFAGVRALGFASDLGDSLTLGLVGKGFRDNVEEAKQSRERASLLGDDKKEMAIRAGLGAADSILKEGGSRPRRAFDTPVIGSGIKDTGAGPVTGSTPSIRIPPTPIGEPPKHGVPADIAGGLRNNIPTSTTPNNINVTWRDKPAATPAAATATATPAAATATPTATPPTTTPAATKPVATPPTGKIDEVKNAAGGILDKGKTKFGPTARNAVGLGGLYVLQDRAQRAGDSFDKGEFKDGIEHLAGAGAGGAAAVWAAKPYLNKQAVKNWYNTPAWDKNGSTTNNLGRAAYNSGAALGEAGEAAKAFSEGDNVSGVANTLGALSRGAEYASLSKNKHIRNVGNAVKAINAVRDGSSILSAVVPSSLRDAAKRGISFVGNAMVNHPGGDVVQDKPGTSTIGQRNPAPVKAAAKPTTNVDAKGGGKAAQTTAPAQPSTPTTIPTKEQPQAPDDVIKPVTPPQRPNTGRGSGGVRSGEVFVSRDPVTGTPTFSGANIDGSMPLTYTGDQGLISSRRLGAGTVSTVPGYYSGGNNSAAAVDERMAQRRRDAIAAADSGVRIPASSGSGDYWGDIRARRERDLMMSDLRNKPMSDVRRSQMMMDYIKSQEGNAVQSRGQDLQYDLGLRGHDVQSRGQDLQYDLGLRGHNVQARGQDLQYDLGLRNNEATLYGHDVSRYGHDISANNAKINSIRDAVKEENDLLKARLAAAKNERDEARHTGNETNERINRYFSTTDKNGHPTVNVKARKMYLDMANHAAAQEISGLEAQALQYQEGSDERAAYMAQANALRRNPASIFNRQNRMPEQEAMLAAELNTRLTDMGYAPLTNDPEGARVIGYNSEFGNDVYVLADGRRVPAYVIDSDAGNAFTGTIGLGSKTGKYTALMTDYALNRTMPKQKKDAK